jgi:hypothetical protein
MMRLSDRRMAEHRRIRKTNQSQSPSYLTLAALTIAGMYLVSPAAAFTSSGPRPSIDKDITGHSKFSSRLAPLPPFCTNPRSPSLIPKSRLYSSRETDSDKEEWRAMLAAFQMYKAAYGDLKVPTRFVVPSMPPWPGKYTKKTSGDCLTPRPLQ